MDFGLGEDLERFRKEVRNYFDKEWPQELRNWRGWLQPDDPEFLEKTEEFGAMETEEADIDTDRLSELLDEDLADVLEPSDDEFEIPSLEEEPEEIFDEELAESAPADRAYMETPGVMAEAGTVLAGAGTALEATHAAEAPAGISEEKMEAMITKAVQDVVGKVIRETVAEETRKVITETIDALKESLESLKD